MHDDKWVKAQVVLFLLAIPILPMSALAAAASVAYMQKMMDRLSVAGPNGFDEYPEFAALGVQLGGAGFGTIAIVSLGVLAILTLVRFRSAVAVVLSWAIVVAVAFFYLCMVLESLLVLGLLRD